MKKRDDQQAVKSAPLDIFVEEGEEERMKKKNHTSSRNRYNARARMLLVTPEANSLACVHPRIYTCVPFIVSPFFVFESSLSSFSFHALNFGRKIEYYIHTVECSFLSAARFLVYNHLTLLPPCCVAAHISTTLPESIQVIR